MRIQDVLAEGVLATKALLARFYPGFDDSNHTRQPAGLPNHLAWNLGHLALTMHRVAEKLDGKGLPATDFIEGSDRGDRERFGADSVAFKSTPTSDASHYPGLARCIAIFDSACERLAGSARAMSDAQLGALFPWGATQISGALVVQRMVFHNGTHAGQILDLRRGLALPRVIG